MNAAKDPLNVTSGLMAGWTDAVVAAETSALSMLKAEMQGLSMLFGGTSAQRTGAEQRALDAAEEADYDNMPV